MKTRRGRRTKNLPIKTLLLSFCLKLHILVSSTGVQLNIDCQVVAEKQIKAAGNTSSDGYQVLGKMSKSIGSKGDSATVSEASHKQEARISGLMQRVRSAVKHRYLLLMT